MVACVTAALLIVLSLATQHYLDKSGGERLAKSAYRLRLSDRLNTMTQLISSSQQVFNLYMASPNIKYKNSFKRSIKNSLAMLDEIQELHNHIYNTEENIADALSKKINNINKVSEQLFLIRADVFKMYPGLARSSDTQFKINATAISLFNNALAELKEDGNRQLYDHFTKLKDMWRNLIQLNRLYTLNLTTILSEQGLKGQERDMKLLVDSIHNYINQYLTAEKLAAADIGLLTEDVADKLPVILDKWYVSFLEMKKFYDRGNWRADVPVLLKELNPAYLSLYTLLDKLQKNIAVSADNDLGMQYQSQEKVSYLIWFLIIIFIIIIFVIYSLVDVSLIKPITRLAGKIKSRNNHEWTLENEYIKSSEMLDFLNAFLDMQLQISVRQNQLEYMAMHDTLTRLPNRNMLIDKIHKAIEKSAKENSGFVLMLLDLDRFKEINDTLGHQVGDEVLNQVAERLTKCTHATDTVARLGGDEFSILLTDVDMLNVKHVAEKIVHELERVFNIKEHNLYIGSSMGVVVYPEHGNTSHELLKHADIAMYIAKNSNTDYAIYNYKDDIYNVKKLELLSELRNAITDEQLYLKYQPIYDVSGSSIKGFEGLLRWKHPVYGEVMPEDFIANAEQTGLIKRITEKVIVRAISDIVAIREILADVYVSINVTAWDLQDENIISVISNALKKNNLPSSAVLLELTERSMMNDSHRVQSTLKILSETGIRFAVDDFGTGFSSMSYLKQLPISILKVDKSFVYAMAENIDDKLIVHSIIGLAHNLGLSVIAEGVEDAETLSILESLQCDLIQGYLFSKPLQLSQIIERIKNNNVAYLNN